MAQFSFFHAKRSSVPIISHFTILSNLTSAAQGSTNLFSISMDFIPDQFSSVTQLCPTPCNPMDGSTLGFPVHHQLPELAQTHVHQVGDAIQPSHLLPSPSPPAFNLAQHQGLFPMSQLFTSGGQSIEASVSFLPVNIQELILDTSYK